MIRTLIPLTAAALLAAGCASAPDTRHITAPTQATGIGGNTPAGLVDLAAHQMKGNPGDYELRARLLTIAPGGGAAAHPHAGQPGIVRHQGHHRRRPRQCPARAEDRRALG